MVNARVHAPRCGDLVEHVLNAYQELGDTDLPDLLEFADQAMHDWLEEVQLADGGEAALVEHYARLEADRIFAIDHWQVHESHERYTDGCPDCNAAFAVQFGTYFERGVEG